MAHFTGFGNQVDVADNGKTPIYLGESCGIFLDELSTETILAYLTSRSAQGILAIPWHREWDQLPPAFAERTGPTPG